LIDKGSLTILADVCKQNLSAQHREYMLGRGFSANTIDAFDIGTFSLADVLRICNQQKLEDLKIIYKIGTRYTSGFERRIVMPMADAYGNTIGLIGRTLEPEDKRPKYYNSSYQKSAHLFGLDKAKCGIVTAGHVILVEGNLDVMSMHEIGIKTCVGIGGTAFGEGHFQLLMRYTDRMLVATDMDIAGEKAWKHIQDIGKRFQRGSVQAISMARVRLPKGMKDVNDCLRSGGGRELCYELFKVNSGPTTADHWSL
jgi:DNA primase catalytic core